MGSLLAVGVLALGLWCGSAAAAVPAQAPSARDVSSARAVVTALTRYDQTALRLRGRFAAAARA
jgi:hypothetical protein